MTPTPHVCNELAPFDSKGRTRDSTRFWVNVPPGSDREAGVEWSGKRLRRVDLLDALEHETNGRRSARGEPSRPVCLWAARDAERDREPIADHFIDAQLLPNRAAG